MLANLNGKEILLASQSPRRQELMKGLGIDFVVKTSDVEEIYPENLQRNEITEFLCELKANALQIADNQIIITADTIVWHQNKALGKPKNEKEAFEMLNSLSDSAHQVYTSVCLQAKNKKMIFSDETTVFFGKLSAQEITYYINNFKPLDKAGAYGVQDWIGFVGIQKIEGSYYNVMGLPVEKLYHALMKF